MLGPRRFLLLTAAASLVGCGNLFVPPEFMVSAQQAEVIAVHHLGGVVLGGKTQTTDLAAIKRKTGMPKSISESQPTGDYKLADAAYLVFLKGDEAHPFRLGNESGLGKVVVVAKDGHALAATVTPSDLLTEADKQLLQDNP